jgi:hypothetical protein
MIEEQQRLYKEIQERNQKAASTGAGDVTVYEQQERLWKSYHQNQNQNKSSPSSSYDTTAMTVFDRSHNIVVPQSHNPSGSDAVHPNRYGMKQARKVKTATGATGGAIIGGVLFGPAWPLGMVVGGAAGGVAAKQISKAGERRAQRKYEKRNFQQYAASKSALAKGDAAFA